MKIKIIYNVIMNYTYTIISYILSIINEYIYYIAKDNKYNE